MIGGLGGGALNIGGTDNSATGPAIDRSFHSCSQSICRLCRLELDPAIDSRASSINLVFCGGPVAPLRIVNKACCCRIFGGRSCCVCGVDRFELCDRVVSGGSAKAKRCIRRKLIGSEIASGRGSALTIDGPGPLSLDGTSTLDLKVCTDVLRGSEFGACHGAILVATSKRCSCRDLGIEIDVDGSGNGPSRDAKCRCGTHVTTRGHAGG